MLRRKGAHLGIWLVSIFQIARYDNFINNGDG
jgi:hypothetical protein